jgi:hypothetical protein
MGRPTISGGLILMLTPSKELVMSLPISIAKGRVTMEGPPKTYVTCPKCNGSGKQGKLTCIWCKGAGKIANP